MKYLFNFIILCIFMSVFPGACFIFQYFQEHYIVSTVLHNLFDVHVLLTKFHRGFILCFVYSGFKLNEWNFISYCLLVNWLCLFDVHVLFINLLYVVINYLGFMFKWTKCYNIIIWLLRVTSFIGYNYLVCLLALY